MTIMFNKLKVLILFLLFPFLCNGQTLTELDGWLVRNTVALKQDTSLFLNLKTEYFDGKKIIALGEPTHGSADPQLSRFKILKFLVERCGVKTLVLEAASNCEAVNEYLIYGKGSAKEVCKQFDMWMYNTEETEKMMSWIKAYNSRMQPDQKIKFYGIDYVLKKIDLLDSLSNSNLISSGLINSIVLANKKNLERKKSSTEELEMLLDNINLLGDSLYLLKSQIEKNSTDYFNYVSYLCKTSGQSVKAQILGEKLPFFYRDSCMAENVKYISAFASAGNVLVGAHNAHVRKVQGYPMGYYLKEIFGESFYNIGTFTSISTFRAFNWNKESAKYQMKFNQITNITKNSLGETLRNANSKSFYIDFNASEKNAIYHQLFIKPKFNLYAGWLFEPENAKKYYLWDTLSNSYDALIYFHTTSSTTGLK